MTILDMIDRMYAGKVKGFTCVGQNPACSSPDAGKTRKALANFDWMVHINIFDNETASFWKGPGMDPKKVKTAVVLLPAAMEAVLQQTKVSVEISGMQWTIE